MQGFITNQGDDDGDDNDNDKDDDEHTHNDVNIISLHTE